MTEHDPAPRRDRETLEHDRANFKRKIKETRAKDKARRKTDVRSGETLEQRKRIDEAREKALRVLEEGEDGPAAAAQRKLDQHHSILPEDRHEFGTPLPGGAMTAMFVPGGGTEYTSIAPPVILQQSAALFVTLETPGMTVHDARVLAWKHYADGSVHLLISGVVRPEWIDLAKWEKVRFADAKTATSDAYANTPHARHLDPNQPMLFTIPGQEL